LNPAKKKQFSSRRFLGPFTVIRQESNNVIVADLLRSGIQRPIHIRRIKVFHPPKELQSWSDWVTKPILYCGSHHITPPHAR
jgi:hypothetical protein